MQASDTSDFFLIYYLVSFLCIELWILYVYSYQTALPYTVHIHNYVLKFI